MVRTAAAVDPEPDHDEQYRMGCYRTADTSNQFVVDDDRLLADTTAAILRRAGFNAKTAYDGFGALEIAASFHPDRLLTDIMMPGMTQHPARFIGSPTVT
jgi:response regulator RpfG family c-di-GMP phosphodiesterase